MNLGKKKSLAMRTIGVGRERIIFVDSRKDDIKEAITKQDIRDLVKDGAIIVKENSGRKKVVSNKKRSVGNIRKGTKKRKRDYVVLTRKLRRYVDEMKKSGKISKVDSYEIRKKIRNKAFRSRAHLKEHVGGMSNENIEKKKKRK